MDLGTLKKFLWIQSLASLSWLPFDLFTLSSNYHHNLTWSVKLTGNKWVLTKWSKYEILIIFGTIIYDFFWYFRLLQSHAWWSLLSVCWSIMTAFLYHWMKLFDWSQRPMKSHCDNWYSTIHCQSIFHAGIVLWLSLLHDDETQQKAGSIPALLNLSSTRVIWWDTFVGQVIIKIVLDYKYSWNVITLISLALDAGFGSWDDRFRLIFLFQMKPLGLFCTF